jgi:PAS domain S-box-containing protein
MTPREQATSESMFEVALRSIDMPVIIHGPETILYANPAACHALHAPSSDALEGIDIGSLVHPDGHEAGRQRRTLVLQHGQQLRDVPVKLRAMDGTTLYARVDAKRIQWAQDAAILILARFVASE